MKTLKWFCFLTESLLVLILIAATIIEKAESTPFAVRYFYEAPWFTATWGILAVASLTYLLRQRMQRRLPAFLLHVSFIIILAGAFVTHVWGEQGKLHLRIDGAGTTSFQLDGSGKESRLPFAVTLENFEISYYQGTRSPMDYTSQLRIADANGMAQGRVSMNNVFSYRHYRFYQSSYDEDERGATLAVAHDPWGIGITYSGYALLLIAILMLMFSRQSGFAKLLRSPALRKSAVLLAFLAICPFASAVTKQTKALPDSLAQEFGNLYIYYSNRICPFSTVAKDFTTKLYGKSSYKGLTPEQVITGWIFYYDYWKSEPIIKIKDKKTARLLGIDGKYASLNDFFSPNNQFKLDNAATSSANAAPQRGINEANEKFNIIAMVSAGSLLRFFPWKDAKSGTLSWYAPTDNLPVEMPQEQWIFVRRAMSYVNELVVKEDYAAAATVIRKIRIYQRREADGLLPSDHHFQAEQIYDRLVYTFPLAVILLISGVLFFVFYCRRLLSEKRTSRLVPQVANSVLAIGFFYLTALSALRWYVSGHVPLSNGYETMQFMAWVSLLAAFLLQRRFPLAIPFGFLISGLALMVSTMGESNPQVTQLMPVLNSPLLSVHVVLVMIAYSLFAFMMFDGICAIILHFARKGQDKHILYLYTISRLLLYPAVFCLALGIFVGAIWANVSWGRYWGWDPKEVWALITLLIYALAFHAESLPAFRRPLVFHVFSVAAFTSVLLTYFGVNFFLGGMHSYA